MRQRGVPGLLGGPLPAHLLERQAENAHRELAQVNPQLVRAPGVRSDAHKREEPLPACAVNTTEAVRARGSLQRATEMSAS